MNATIVRAPGFADHFKATVIAGLGDIPARDGRGNLAVITFGDEELTVVPASCVVYGVDLVKRLEVEYDFVIGQHGVRHAFGGPFIFYGSEYACERWALRRVRRTACTCPAERLGYDIHTVSCAVAR